MRNQIAGTLILIHISMFIGCGQIMKSDVPVKVLVRESRVGEGLVAQFHNESDRRLVIQVAIENESTRNRTEAPLTIDPDETLEIGWMEGWKFQSGETVEISHEDYRTVKYVIP